MPPSAEPPPADRAGLDPLRRRALSARHGAPFLFPLGLVVVASAAGWLLFREGGAGREAARAVVTSPETQVRQAIAGQRKVRLGDVYGFSAGGLATLDPLTYSDVSVQVEGKRASVLAVVDGTGEVTWKDHRASLSYLGREAFAMTPCNAAGWCADGAQFRKLRSALSVLFRRLDGFERGDLDLYRIIVSERYEGGRAALLARLKQDLASAPARRLVVKGWQIRVERDTATVGEDYELSVGDGPPRALRARYDLAWEDGRWRIVAGL
ncbi:MAG: nuclear transport factor 2 family protein [Anaeromyxobacter sp.]